jgi:hypothetical protein
LLARVSPVCALLSTTYEKQFGSRIVWCGIYTTFGGSDVSN